MSIEDRNRIHTRMNRAKAAELYSQAGSCLVLVMRAFTSSHESFIHGRRLAHRCLSPLLNAVLKPKHLVGAVRATPLSFGPKLTLLHAIAMHAPSFFSEPHLLCSVAHIATLFSPPPIHSFFHPFASSFVFGPPVNRNLSVIRIMLLCFALLGALHWLGERRRLLTHVQLGVSAFNYGKLMPGGETGLEQQQQSAPISPIAITCTALYIIAHFWSLSSHVSKPKVTHTTTCLSALVSTAPPVRLANLSHQPGSHHRPQQCA